jgi:hypothetical protein
MSISIVKIKNSQIIQLALLLSLLIPACMSYAATSAGCTGHIYNNSSQPWEFSALSLDGGAVYFDGCGNSKNGPCSLSAGSVTKISYTTTQGYVKGQMKICDSQTPSNCKKVSFGKNAFYSCVYSDYHGKGGAVHFDSPGDGDYTIVADHW